MQSMFVFHYRSEHFNEKKLEELPKRVCVRTEIDWACVCKRARAKGRGHRICELSEGERKVFARGMHSDTADDFGFNKCFSVGSLSAAHYTRITPWDSLCWLRSSISLNRLYTTTAMQRAVLLYFFLRPPVFCRPSLIHQRNRFRQNKAAEKTHTCTLAHSHAINQLVCIPMKLHIVTMSGSVLRISTRNSTGTYIHMSL